MAELRQHFRPEFLNRLDEIVVFQPARRGSSCARSSTSSSTASPSAWPSATYGFEVSDAAKDLLGNFGYDPTYGARPLKRVIQQRVLENPLAEAILSGEFKNGDTVVVRAADGAIKLDRRAAPSTVAPAASEAAQ